MGYHVLDPTSLEPMSDRPCESYAIGDVAELEILGLRVYAANPGEQIPLAYHSHEEQEEAFYVIDGTLHVETPEEVVIVPAGSVFVAEPESPHRAYNPEDADGPVRVFATGAPSGDDVVEYAP